MKTTNNKQYRLIIFDWDGTLMDSSAHITACMQAAIGEYGGEKRSDAQVRNIIGLGLAEAIQALYPDADDVFIQQVSMAFRIQFMSPDRTPSTLFSGAEEMLQTLQQQGYDLAVATGKSRQGLNKVLHETGLVDYFPITRCADETFSKPHPKMLEEILIDHNLNVEQALMIGDTEYDIQMAHNANMDALAVSFGVHELSRLLAVNPLGYVNTLIEIPNWLENYE